MDTFEKDQADDLVEDDILLLSDMTAGQRCIVVRIQNRRAVAHRLVEMGVVRGTVIDVESPGPFGDPMKVKIKGYHLSLRSDEAACIEVQCL